MKIDKSQGVPALLAALVSFCLLLGIMWTIVRPLISTAVAQDLKDDIEKAVANELAPIKNGFQVIIQDRIIQLRKDIALLQRKQLAEGLTIEETTRIVDLTAQLEAQERALQGLL